MYEAYLKERLGHNVIKSDHGFLVWSEHSSGLVIEELFVKPELRHKGIASQLVSLLEQKAKELDHSKIYGFIWPNITGASQVMLAALKYGFVLFHSQQDKITIMLEVEGAD